MKDVLSGPISGNVVSMSGGRTIVVVGTGLVALTAVAAISFRPLASTLPDVKAPGPGRYGIRLGIRPYVPPDSPAILPESPTIEPGLQRSVIVTVGVLRQDAILVPFANFDGQYWVNDWPEPYHPGSQERPWEIPPQASEAPSEWWGRGESDLRWELLEPGGVRKIVAATGIREFPTHCEANIGLTTDFPSRLRGDAYSFERRYAGVVATSDNLLTPIARLAKDDHEFQEVNRFLPQVFSRLEPDVWKGTVGSEFEPSLTGPLPAPTLNLLNRGMLPDGREIFVFHARRGLPRRALDRRPSKMATQVVGWLTREGSGPLVLHDVHGSQTDADGMTGEGTFIPMAALTVAGRSFWLGSWRFYESEAYGVVEVGKGLPSVQMTAGAGGC